ncbi:MAG TPA: hypothetical protein VF750_01440 [Sphingomicrobium sp.]
MSTSAMIILLIAGAALIILIAGRRSGPRVTQIDRTVRKEKDPSDA